MEKSIKSQLPFHLVTFQKKGPLIAFACGNDVLIFDKEKEDFIQSQDFHENSHKDLVRSIAFSENLPLFVSGGDDKQVKIWNTSTWKCVGSKKLGKKISNATFGSKIDSKDSENNTDTVVIFSDKFGDVYYANLPDLPEPILLLGHCSTVTSLILSPTREFLITSDRDEKIRVNRFPEAYDIQSFCLGHRSFVSKLLIPKHQPHLLVSGGGDGTVRLWNYLDGNLLSTVEIEQAGVISSLSYNEKYNVICVLVEGQNVAFIYAITDKGDLSMIQRLSLDASSSIYDANFDDGGNLWIVGASPLIQYFEYNGQGFKSANTSAVQKILHFGTSEVEDGNIENIRKKLSFTNLKKPEFDNRRRKNE